MGYGLVDKPGYPENVTPYTPTTSLVEDGGVQVQDGGVDVQDTA
jgi:hypothetical protein